MRNSEKITPGTDMGTVVVACLFIIMAIVSLWDTTTMMDSDSYVFPRAIAIVMILLCLTLIISNLIRSTGEKLEKAKGVSTIRRISLVTVMLLSCVLMPWLGFLISGFATFLLLMLVSMYDEWSPAKKIIYPLVAVTIVAAFYTLFSKLLMVPLPVGLFFE